MLVSCEARIRRGAVAGRGKKNQVSKTGKGTSSQIAENQKSRVGGPISRRLCETWESRNREGHEFTRAFKPLNMGTRFSA